MAPLITLACILVGALGNLWLFSGMPRVKPMFILMVASLLSAIYFVFAMPVFVAVLARRFRRTQQLTANLLVEVVMLLVFYISAGVTWALISRHWSLSFLETLQAARDAERYAKFEHDAESAIFFLLVVSTISTVVAGTVTLTLRSLWERFRQKAI